MSIAGQILRARTSRKARLVDVANFCGLSRADVFDFERGRRIPSDQELDRLEHCFDIKFDREDTEVEIMLQF